MCHASKNQSDAQEGDTRAGLWICPNTGHAINLKRPAAFNAQVEDF